MPVSKQWQAKGVCVWAARHKAHCKQVRAPDSVPAELDRPMRMPACAGAMSMWLTEKPPREKAAMASVAVVAVVPPRKVLAAGMAMSARLVPMKPGGHEASDFGRGGV